MTSITNIPEPSTAHPSATDDAVEHAVPLGMSGRSPEPTRMKHEVDDRADHQIDGLSCMLLLLIAGALLRIVLGVLGPLQGGLPSERIEQLIAQSKSLLNGSPVDAFPLLELVTSTVASGSLPMWAVVMVGSLLSLAAIPAAYTIGRATTGRRVPGVIGAALIAVHPAALSASISFSSASYALSLTTIGLALICIAHKRGFSNIIAGGIILALAGLTAPICWVVGLAAGPLALRLQFEQSKAKALSFGLFAIIIAVGPVMAYRAVFFGHDAESLALEFVTTEKAAEAFTPTERIMVSMTDASLGELGTALSLPLSDAGRLNFDRSVKVSENRDVVADTLADAWMLMNTGLACLAVLSIGVMLLRLRIVELLVLAGPIAALAFCVLPPGESLRLPMIALVGVLSMGLFAKRPVEVLSEEAKAKKAAKEAAKKAAKEEKERARQERRSTKELSKLNSFEAAHNSIEKKHRDKQQKKQARQNKIQPDAEDIKNGVLTERVADDSAIPMRPI